MGAHSTTEMYERARQDLHASIVYLGVMNNLFYSDTERCLRTCIEKNKAIEKNEIDYNELMFWYRSLIRTFYAYVEGTTFLMRQIIIWAHERSDIKLSDSEIMQLREVRLVGDGESVKTCAKHNTVLENVTLAFEYFPVMFHSSYELTKSDHRWDSFRTALKARDSITHPKLVEDYLLPAEVLRQLQEAIVWFHESMSGLTKSCGNGRKSENDS